MGVKVDEGLGGTRGVARERLYVTKFHLCDYAERNAAARADLAEFRPQTPIAIRRSVEVAIFSMDAGDTAECLGTNAWV